MKNQERKKERERDGEREKPIERVQETGKFKLTEVWTDRERQREGDKCPKLAKSEKIVENEVFRLFRCSKLLTKSFRIFSWSSYVRVWKLVKILP